MKQMWENRYQVSDFAYGKKPNEFFKKWLPQFTPGSILMPADGEGRNGVFAAQQGWQVTCFDLSSAGKTKAQQLAQEQHVTIDYQVGDFAQLEFEASSFDAIGLIYAHFPAAQKSSFHQRLDQYLKPGGIIIFEAFSKKHLPYRERNPKVGGPADLAMLFSTEELRSDFTDYEVLYLQEEITQLQEGKYHLGEAMVARFVGRKK